MADMTNVISNTVPISLFNKGQAGRIFADVKKSGAKVVMKNNVAECVLLSPTEYRQLMDEINDARLLAMAAERMKDYDPSKTVSEQDMLKRLGMSEQNLMGYEKVEIE